MAQVGDTPWSISGNAIVDVDGNRVCFGASPDVLARVVRCVNSRSADHRRVDYSRKKVLQMVGNLPNAFQATFGMSGGALRRTWKLFVENEIKKNYPRLCRSAARDVLEGAVTGVPAAILGVPISHRLRWELVMMLLDVFETIRESAGLRAVERVAEEEQKKLLQKIVMADDRTTGVARTTEKIQRAHDNAVVAALVENHDG